MLIYPSEDGAELALCLLGIQSKTGFSSLPSPAITHAAHFRVQQTKAISQP